MKFFSDEKVTPAYSIANVLKKEEPRQSILKTDLFGQVLKDVPKVVKPK